MDILGIREDIATILIAGLIIVIFLVPYILRIRKNNRQMLEHQKDAVESGTNKPLMQHPLFDLAACIGCGICTRVCPEGNVLGVVNGKVAIINGVHCIGHGECSRQCPVGAINIGLGDISTREDIPALSEDLETTIPGLFIAGELGGMALIKNAIQQGVSAVDAIEKRLKLDPNPNSSVLIAGAGPAGLSAALRCAELNIPYQIIDQDYPGGTILNYPRKKLTMVQPVVLPLFGALRNGTYSKEELLEIWDDLISRYHINILNQHKLTKIDRLSDGFKIQTEGGLLQASHVILALGRRGTPRKLGVPGEELSKVMYKLIDASGYSNNSLLVVGGGDSAVEAAMGLASQKGNKVTISYRKEQFFRLKKRNRDLIQSMLRLRELEAIFSSNVKEIRTGEVILDTQEGEKVLKNDYTFIFAGGQLPFPLLNSMGIQFGAQIKSQT